MLHDITVAIYITTAGFTLSGIVSNLYRLLAGNNDRYGRTVYLATMVVAGPNVLFEKAVAAFREKRWPPVAFWLATAVTCYWSLALGLFLISTLLAIF